jgi:signal transduction histidine kinase/CheY-like chemotaxis protein
MSTTHNQHPRWQAVRERILLYGVAVVTGMIYFFVGRLGSNNSDFTAVNLPLGALSIIVLGMAGVEAWLFYRRLSRSNHELREARAREAALAQRLAYHRQTVLNEISRGLIDCLDVNQISTSVLERIGSLFDADIVTVWGVNRTPGADAAIKGVHGLHQPTAPQIEALRLALPSFTKTDSQFPQLLIADITREPNSLLTAFCQKEKIASLAFSPIVRRNELVGGLGVFFRKPLIIFPALATDIQTVANLIASVIQAEELYRDLIQIQKVESIGTLASGIAHDFNNVLAAILACASYVKQHTKSTDPTYRYLEATEASAHKGAALTKQLLSFARREAPRPTVLNPNERIETTLHMLERSFDKNILVQRQFAPDLRPVEMDASQFEQVILNVAVNARDVMPHGGIFTIQTRNKRLDITDPYRPALALPDGEYVVIGLRDTGPGMDAATQKRIFEAFFTTKDPGKGTGLGLSVVLSVVRTAGGDIRVQSEPGKGALFEVYLPATSKPLPVAPTAATTPARGGAEGVLIAEDEELIREMAQLGLEDKGYQVLAAPDGAAALNLYRQRWSEIEVVVIDMVMPHMSGPELFAAMKEINPGVRVIVSSGYSHDLEGQRMLQHGCLGFLQKPYTAEALAQAIRSVLDSGL